MPHSPIPATKSSCWAPGLAAAVAIATGTIGARRYFGCGLGFAPGFCGPFFFVTSLP